jgi:hypothetical protein
MPAVAVSAIAPAAAGAAPAAGPAAASGQEPREERVELGDTILRDLDRDLLGAGGGFVGVRVHF